MDMNSGAHKIAFALEQADLCAHFCLVYKAAQERQAVVTPFIRIGLARAERCIYLAADGAETALDALRNAGVDVDMAQQAGALVVADAGEAFLRGGRFEVGNLAAALTDFAAASEAAGFKALRLVIDMSWAHGTDEWATQLKMMEAKCNQARVGLKASLLCLYDRTRFAPDVIRDAIHMHPDVINDGYVCRNDYYVPPDEFFGPDQPVREVDRLLSRLRSCAQTEMSLQGKEAQLRQIIDLVPQMIFARDREGRFILVNRALAALYGETASTLTGKFLSDVHPVEAEYTQFLQEDAEVIASGKPLVISENVVTDVDGCRHIVETTKIPFLSVESDTRAVLGVSVLITERKKAENVLERLLELGQMLASSRDLDDVLARVVRYAVDIIEAAERGSVQLLQEDGEVLQTVMTDKYNSQFTSTLAFKVGRGVAGHALASGKVVNVPDVCEDARFVPGEYPLRFRSLMVVPLIIDEHPLGTLSVSSAKVEAFDADDEMLLQLMAGQMAVALESARLFGALHQRQDELESLLETNRELSSTLDLDQLLKFIAQRALALLSADEFVLFRLQEDGVTLKPVLALGEYADTFMNFSLQVGEGVTGMSVAQNRPILANNAQSDSRTTHVPGTPQEDHEHIMVTPLAFRGHITGAMLVNRVNKRPFLDENLVIFAGFAQQVAVVIENARLFEAEREQRTLAEALRDTADALNSTLDPDEVLDLILDNVGRVVSHDAACIILIEAGEAHVVRCRGYTNHDVPKEAALGMHFPVAEVTNMCQMIKTGQPFVIPDVQTDPDWVSFPETRWIRSSVSAPIRLEGKVSGFLDLDSATPDVFTSVHAERLQIFADQAAIAIENARLFEKAKRRAAQLSTLNEIGRAVSLLLDRESIFELIYNQLQYALPLDVFVIALYDPETSLLSFPLVYETGRRYYEPPSRLTTDSHLSEPIRTAQPALINRVPEKYHHAPQHPLGDVGELSASLLYAPLRVGDRVIGVISAQSHQLNAYDQEHLDLLTGVAHHAAIAIETARLFEQAATALSEAGMLTALIEATSDMVMVSDLDQNILHINPAGLRMVGYAETDNRALKIADFFPPEAYRELTDTVWPRVLEEDIWSGETVLRHRDGTLIPVSEVVVVVRDAEDNPIGFGVTVRDISAERAAAHEREELLATVQQHSMQLQTAAEVSAAASSTLTLENLQRTVVNLIHDRFDFYYVGLFLIDQDGTLTGEPDKWLVLRAGTGTAGAAMLAEGHKLAVGGASMVGWCAANARARVPLDVDEERRWRFNNAHLPLTRSEMALPLITRGQVIGALSIQSAMASAFSDTDITVLQTMTAQIANTIENARLLEQAQRHAAHLLMLNGISSAISSQIDRDSILEVIYTQFQRAIPLDAFYICLYDEESKTVSYPLVYDEGKRYYESSQEFPHNTLLAKTIETATPQLLNRSVEELRALKARHSIGDADKLTASFMFAPLQGGARVIGAISAQSYQFDAYNQEHLKLLVGVATQAAIAIEKARLHAEVQRHAEALERRVEARTAELRNALIRAQDSERAKLNFVSTVNHELRTPLANLKLYLGLLRKGKPGKRDEYLNTLEREISRLANLVEDILAIARLDDNDAPLQWERQNLLAIAEDAAHRFMPLAESRSIDFVFNNTSGTDGYINADASQIMRVFVNLLGNALTYTPRGGKVTLSVETRQAGGGEWAVIVVQDNGPGIASEETRQIFERFYRGAVGRDSGLPGSGLGLAIVNDIVQLHNGRVELESRLGEGSTFSVWLPRA